MAGKHLHENQSKLSLWGESMTSDLANYLSVASAGLSAVAAVFAAICAILSFRLAKRIWIEEKSDERLIFENISHPALQDRHHAQSVIQIPVFNKSKRKAHISKISAYDQRNNGIPIAWSSDMESLTRPMHPSDSLGVVDSATIYIRRTDGEPLDFARIFLRHSFVLGEEELFFDQYRAYKRSVMGIVRGQRVDG